MVKKVLYWGLGGLILLALTAVLVCLMAARADGCEIVHTVRWMQDGEVLAEQRVLHGMRVKDVSAQPEGARFLGWLDEDGAAVSPGGQKAMRSAVYTAQLAPALRGGHPAFLFFDDIGLLRPDAPFTGAALDAALEALRAPEAAGALPGLTAETLTRGQLLAALDGWFAVPALEALGAEADDGAALTRADAAALLNTLLGRAADPDALGAPDIADLTAEHAQYAALLEAAFSHEPEADGAPCRLELTHGDAPHPEPGFLRDGAALYYVQEDGSLLKNGEVGTLHFDENGRYTSGNAELDGYVNAILLELDPDGTMTRDALLEAAYDHVVHGYTYLRVNYYDFGATGWEIDEALGMFRRGRGNCYCYAAAFWSLARALGYDARAISGTMTETNQPHGWVEIDFDGVPYVFDTETEYAYYRDGRTPKRMFHCSYAAVASWHYRRP